MDRAGLLADLARGRRAAGRYGEGTGVGVAGAGLGGGVGVWSGGCGGTGPLACG